ncbi:Uncharacterised protein [uncultured archaeon]|nr:Uncharacterised protein [uncultured archaeon]
MDNKKKLLMLAKRSESVRESLVNLINNGRAYSAEVSNILDDYNKILGTAKKIDSDIEAPMVSKYNPEYLAGAMGALTSAIKISAGDGTEDIETLKSEANGLKKQNSELTQSLSRLIGSDEMKPDEKFLALLPNKLRNRIIEAYISYNHGAYIATCLLCGTVMEGLIIEATEGNYSFKNLNERIAFLINQTKINPNESGKLLGIMKEYRDYSAHPTSKIFEKQNASLFINALIILTKDLHSKQ